MNKRKLSHVSSRFIKYALQYLSVSKLPQHLEGAGMRFEVGQYCKSKGYERALVVTDKGILDTGMVEKLCEGLKKEGILYVIYDNVKPNPTFGMAKEGRDIGIEFGAKCVIAFGGGSVMDCSKVISGAIASPKRKIESLGIPFSVLKAIPLITIPTTAGTGAEISMGAIMSNDVTHKKMSGGSKAFLAEFTVLDPEITQKLPPALTASTGFDALSHAIEAYLSVAKAKKEADDYCLEAAKLIVENLPKAYWDGSNLEYRSKMAKGAFLAGMALNLKAATYAHPIAHALGGVYNIAHGEAIAIALPPILRYNQESSKEKLAKLALACGLGTSSENSSTLAVRFVDKIFALREELQLPTTCEQLKREDFEKVTDYFWGEALMYPVPKYMSDADIASLLESLLKK